MARGTERGHGVYDQTIEWQNYTPILSLCDGNVPPVIAQPDLGDMTSAAAGGLQRGRYANIGNKTIICQFQVLFSSSGASAGGPGGFYEISLPVTARRAHFQADRPLGSGGICRFLQIPMTPTVVLMGDWHGRAGGPDDNCMMFIPWTRTVGTTSIASGTTSTIVTHGHGTTPGVSDIHLVPTNSPTTDPGNVWVSAVGATTFTVNSRTDPGAGGAAFSYKIHSEAGQVAGPNLPWAWGSWGDGFYGNLIYEAK